MSDVPPDAPAPGAAAPDAPGNTERSPRRGMCAAVLSLEAIALGLTTPVMITIAGVATGTALSVGLGLAVVCLLLAGMLRAEWAYLAGYAVQAAAIALGFVVPVMFGLGLVFAVLWAAADQLGRKIERERAAAWAAYRAEQG
jgi:hypothetical protein